MKNAVLPPSEVGLEQCPFRVAITVEEEPVNSLFLIPSRPLTTNDDVFLSSSHSVHCHVTVVTSSDVNVFVVEWTDTIGPTKPFNESFFGTTGICVMIH